MAGQIRSTRLPWFVPYFNPIAKTFLAVGIPMGPNVLVTIRGRKSGLPRTTPLTIVEYSGRRWLMAPFGDVNWVRNLRAAGRATITVGRRKEEVLAVELSPAETVAFFRDVLGPRVQRTRVGAWIVRHLDQVDVDHPEEAAQGRPVFELHLLTPGS
jgi:deazaflavin-dependent oxidoreductase (nitroreductase family)